MKGVDLNTYSNHNYNPGNVLKRLLWYAVNAIFFDSYWFPSSQLKVFFLRLFGAKIGRGVVIKPRVSIKYPWFLEVGDFTWVGERVWIDNLTDVQIGSNACLSQGAFLLTGNHDYKSVQFDLMVQGIQLNDGAWVGAQAKLMPGTVMESHAVLQAGAIGSGKLNAFTIYGGTPAIELKKREIR